MKIICFCSILGERLIETRKLTVYDRKPIKFSTVFVLFNFLESCTVLESFELKVQDDFRRIWFFADISRTVDHIEKIIACGKKEIEFSTILMIINFSLSCRRSCINGAESFVSIIPYRYLRIFLELKVGWKNLLKFPESKQNFLQLLSL